MRNLSPRFSRLSLSAKPIWNQQKDPTDLETKSLFRRRHQMAAKASAVKAQHPSVTDQNGCLTSQAVHETAQHFSMPGDEISAHAIMAGIALQGVKPAQLLARANLAGISQVSLKPDQATIERWTRKKRSLPLTPRIRSELRPLGKPHLPFIECVLETTGTQISTCCGA